MNKSKIKLISLFIVIIFAFSGIFSASALNNSNSDLNNTQVSSDINNNQNKKITLPNWDIDKTPISKEKKEKIDKIKKQMMTLNMDSKKMPEFASKEKERLKYVSDTYNSLSNELEKAGAIKLSKEQKLQYVNTLTEMAILNETPYYLDTDCPPPIDTVPDYSYLMGDVSFYIIYYTSGSYEIGEVYMTPNLSGQGNCLSKYTPIPNLYEGTDWGQLNADLITSIVVAVVGGIATQASGLGWVGVTVDGASSIAPIVLGLLHTTQILPGANYPSLSGNICSYSYIEHYWVLDYDSYDYNYHFRVSSNSAVMTETWTFIDETCFQNPSEIIEYILYDPNFDGLSSAIQCSQSNSVVHQHVQKILHSGSDTLTVQPHFVEIHPSQPAG